MIKDCERILFRHVTRLTTQGAVALMLESPEFFFPGQAGAGVTFVSSITKIPLPTHLYNTPEKLELVF